ncbi:unnamed protein product [Closterium sp. NIES-53]
MSGSPRSNNGSSVTSPSRPKAFPAADNSHLQQQQQQQQHQYQQQPMYGMPLSSQPVHTTTAAASSTAAAATASTAAAAVPGSSSQPGQQSNFVSTGPYQYQACTALLALLITPHFDYGDDKGSYALLVAYVDDILYVSSSTLLGDRIEADLKKSLDLTISTKVTQFLGLNVSRTPSAIHLTASKYAESLAKRFNISTDFVATPYRSTLTGHVPNLKNLSAAGLQLYQQQLRCLLFAVVTCRPDLAYIASHLAQFLRCPKEEHSLDLHRALRYFVSTPTLGLIFNAGKPTDKMYLSGYVDADHAADTSDRRSRTGYIFRLEPIGPISWNSSKQELVSLSSAEAEFIAACAATREGLYLQELLDEAKFVTPNQFTLQCDNQSAITIANKPGFVNRTKHISL